MAVRPTAATGRKKRKQKKRKAIAKLFTLNPNTWKRKAIVKLFALRANAISVLKEVRYLHDNSKMLDLLKFR